MSNRFIKSILFVLPMTILMSSIATATPIGVYINNSKQYMPTNPVLNQGRSLVPLRAIFETMGAKVNWNQDTKTITGGKDNIEIKLSIGDKIATVNDKKVVLDVPATVINGSTLVPTRFIAESLGAKVEWDNKARSILINSNFTDINNNIKNNYSNAEYSYSDNELFIFELDKFISQYGQPITQKEVYNYYFESYDKILSYNFGTVTFANYDGYNYSLKDISSTASLIGLPRNIKIGDSVESVINKFRSDGNSEDVYISNELSANEKLLYQSNAKYDNGPSMGIIRYDNKNKVSNIEYLLDYQGGGITSFSMKVKDNKVHSVSMFFGDM